MNVIDTYYKELCDTLAEINGTQRDKIEAAARRAAKVIEDDGIIYVFGCGHSNLVAADSFYRAGGLANVCAMFDTDLMLHNGAAKSSAIERMEGVAPHIFKRYCITSHDMLIVVSSSGLNGVPIEMADLGRKAGVFTVAVCSSAYFNEVSRHSSGKLLYQNADVYIDNCVPKGDAVVDIGDMKMGAVSTAASCFVLNAVLTQGAEYASAKTKPPIYISGNIEGGAEKNEALINKYYGRIKHL